MKKNDFVVLDGMVNLQYRDEIRLLLKKGIREEKRINSGTLLGHLLVASLTVVKVHGSLYQDHQQFSSLRNEGMGHMHHRHHERISTSSPNLKETLNG